MPHIIICLTEHNVQDFIKNNSSLTSIPIILKKIAKRTSVPIKVCCKDVLYIMKKKSIFVSNF